MIESACTCPLLSLINRFGSAHLHCIHSDFMELDDASRILKSSQPKANLQSPVYPVHGFGTHRTKPSYESSFVYRTNLIEQHYRIHICPAFSCPQ